MILMKLVILVMIVILVIMLIIIIIITTTTMIVVTTLKLIVIAILGMIYLIPLAGWLLCFIALVVNNNWFDGVLLSMLDMFKP